MTVSSGTNRASYSGNGSLTTFSYNFKIFDEDDLTVILRAANGTETTQTITTDYTVTGVGDVGGGNVVFGTAPTATETIVILREQPLTQGLDLVPNDPFPANSLEDALDKLTFITQQHSEELSRSIKASKTNAITSTEFTVNSNDRANKVFAFDSAGELSVAQELGNYRGDWSSSTSFVERDLIKDTTNGNIYICLTSHTSTGSLPIGSNADISKWELIVDAETASGSATGAATSAADAATSATDAATSATDAATSATDAATSAAAASASEAGVAASASAAATSATDASTSETNAAASETNAATSATASADSAAEAATSETNAATSETNAAASETNAATSASAASTAATNATTQASAATTSAASAATSETNAATSETNAATSETNAATSATAAAASQTAAATSETNASTSETNAAASETNAATSETNAATSETNAATSASTAASEATNAATSAASASTSETNAAASEANAASSASSAATSATSAQASKDAALAALDSFDERYLGQKPSDPTVDNDGDPLVAGALYFNTTDDVMKVYEGSSWVAAYASLSGAAIAANNLSDLVSVSAARTNLGLGTAATTDSTDYATAAQGSLADSALQAGGNVSDLTNDAGYTTNVGEITGVTAGSGITGGGTSGTVTISHEDTSSQASVDNSDGTVIQDVTIDTYGHVTGLGSKTLTASDVGAMTATNPVVASGTITEDVYGMSGTSVALEPDNGSIQTHTLSGNTTYTDAFSAGQGITLMIDDGSASTVSWPTMTWVNNEGSAPELATSGYTVVALWKVGTTLYGALVGDGS